MVFTTEADEEGDAEDSIEIESTTGDIKIVVNCDLVLKCLTSMRSKKVEIFFKDEATFLKFKSVDKEVYNNKFVYFHQSKIG